jgi:glutathione S-transferase
VRLTAALLQLPIARVEYDIMKGETRTPEFLAQVNPNGRIPVLQFGNRFITESNAACFYLAEGSSLVPTKPFDRADMLRWMFWEQYSHEPNIAAPRFWLLYIGLEHLNDLQRTQLPARLQAGNDALKLMDDHLASRDWFVGRSITLADICLFAYTHVAEDAQFDLNAYPNVTRWIERVKAHPRYVAAGA